MVPFRDEILEALASPQKHPLADAVASAIKRYSQQFSAAVERSGGYGGAIQLAQPANEIEAVAFDLFVEQVQEAMPGTRITVKAPSS